MLDYNCKMYLYLLVNEESGMDARYNEDGNLIVKENHYCEHWEPDDGALVPMRECWCCKWSKFRADNNLMSDSIGICCYSGNRSELTSQEVN